MGRLFILLSLDFDYTFSYSFTGSAQALNMSEMDPRGQTTHGNCYDNIVLYFSPPFLKKKKIITRCCVVSRVIVYLNLGIRSLHTKF